MSQEQQKGKGKASNGPPRYMQVGDGSLGESAKRLQAILGNDVDSGYGGSADGDFTDGASSSVPAWNPTMTPDRPTPAHTPVSKGEPNAAADHERQVQATAIHQLWYNSHRSALGRSINRTVETLKELQEMNATWPVTYPTVQSSDSTPHPGLNRTATTLSSTQMSPPRPGRMQRSQTTLAESSKTAKETAPEPRLVSEQIAQQFSILKLDLKVNHLYQADLVHSLEKSSIAALLDGCLSSSINHLRALRERIEDTSSKVLVTGDVNVGKSTFCNALLRRKVLPEDQLQNTSIFCEVLDCRENGGVEEVHAIHKDATYNRHDESTYDVFALTDLETLVTDKETYGWCKIYLRDIRSIDQSLLNNGVVDISIIDAPSLNRENEQTTAVFARQEEIDVVVFVVSAANQITLSAREFIFAAANEKAYIFMVVNGYEVIKDKERFRKEILKQIGGLSPQTQKNSSELVHFVSSNAIPTAPPPGAIQGGDGGSGGSGGGGDGPDYDDGSDPKGKGKEKEKEKLQDFEHLEQSLRRFVLEKRARSKLAPAKTYLMNVLGDVHTLAVVNQSVAQSELDRVTLDLADIEPKLEASKKAKTETSDEIDRTIEETCKDIYSHTRAILNSSIARSAEGDHGIAYPGLFSAFQYADDLKEVMLNQISSSVTTCENHARTRTIDGIGSIQALGHEHLGDEYADKNLVFKSDDMFQRKRDILARHIEIETELWDFFDFSTIFHQQEKLAGTGMAMTVATVVGGRMVGGFGWVDGAMSAAKVVGSKNLRAMIVPGVLAAAVLATAYVLQQIPHSLPHRLATKISTQLASIDYVHANSTRISSKARKLLLIPANNLRVGLQRSVEELGFKREDTRKVRQESEVARKYFSNLVTKTSELRNTVDRVDLEGPAPGVAASYDP